VPINLLVLFCVTVISLLIMYFQINIHNRLLEFNICGHIALWTASQVAIMSHSFISMLWVIALFCIYKSGPTRNIEG
jgi:hypothetical protein